MANRVFQAVAMPSMVMFAPVLPAGANMAMNAVLMMFAQVAFAGSVNPLIFIGTAAVGHIILMIAGFKEPHLSTMLQAKADSRRRSRNLIKPRRFKVKYVP